MPDGKHFTKRKITTSMHKFYVWTSLACLAIVFSDCQSNKANKATTETAEVEETAMPGSDRDEHGCIGSAGYVWSEIKKDCIRPFEAGLKLNGVTPENSQYAAYAVFSPDSMEVELFMPQTPGNTILSREENEWKNDSISLAFNNGIGTITQSGTAIFSTTSPNK